MIPRTATSGNVRRHSPRRLAFLAGFALVAAVGSAACDVKVRDEEDGSAGSGGTSSSLTPGSPGAWKSPCTKREDCLEENAVCVANPAVPGAGRCTGPLAKRAYLAECAPYADGGGEVCSGFTCQAMPANNVQGKQGICTLGGCLRDADCGAGAICYAQGLVQLCLATCASSDDCAGFACVSASPTINVCLVQTQ